LKSIPGEYRLLTWFLKTAILSFFTLPSFSQVIDPSNLLFQYLTIENGLPHNKVNAVSMDKDGFMWFGTNDGICRYDGMLLKTYSLNNLAEGQIRTPQISVIRTDSRGNLLIGTYSLLRYNYLMDRIELCDSITQLNGTGRVYAIEEGKEGKIWFGTEKGLYSYNTDKDSITAYLPEDRSNISIISLLADEDKLWIGTRNNGLLVFDIQSKRYSEIPRFRLSNELKDQINCMYKDKNNAIWAGTQDNGIYKFNLKDSSLTHVYPEIGNTMSYRIRKIINDRYGNIWVGSRLGIFFQQAGTDSLKLIKQVDPLPSKTRSNSIYDIFIDRNEIMWVGTFSFGLAYTDFRRKPFHLYNLSDYETEFSAKMINCFADCDDENIWIGTEESGLFLYNRNTLKFRQFLPEKNNKNSLAGVNVKAMVKEPEGNLWIGYYAAGLDYLDVKTGKITHNKTGLKKNYSITSNSIRSLLLDKNEDLFIGTDKGVDLLKKGSIQFLHLNLNIEILTLYEDNLNRIWAGSSGDGIYLFNRESLKFERRYSNYFTTSIKAIIVDSHENMWIGTNKGLYFVNSRNDSLLHFGTNEGLPSGIILDILEDNNHNLWVSTGTGLVKCESAVSSPGNFSIKQYNIHDGLQGVQFRESASFKNSKGELYFGGVQGFNIFRPDSIKSNPYLPRLAFTRLKIFNKDVEIGEKIGGQIVLNKAINQTKQLTLLYNLSPVSIEFSALHFSNPDKNTYKFMLSPLEKEWNYSTGIRNFASYSNLQGGDYSFIVEAANSDGLWNPEPLILKIRIIPPFWKTWWFLGIIFIIISASVFGYYLYRISLLKRYNAELEQKVEDRTHKLKESFDQLLEKQNFIEEQSKTLKQQKDQLQELNSTKDKFFSIIAHDLRSPFQALLGLSEMLISEMNESNSADQKIFVRKIHESTSHIFSLVENLLTWSRAQTNKISFQPERISLASIIDNVVTLSEPIFTAKKITVNKIYKSNKEGYADKPMIELVIRNLVSNAIKFTPENGQISISLTESNKEFQVEIRDNGVGISTEDQKKLFGLDTSYSKKGTNGEKGTGLGLIICREFIEKNNGKIWVESLPGKGSSFFFTIPASGQPEN
jgi:signal transduction histidine kinase/ligand-binding sensor domain-containing protein